MPAFIPRSLHDDSNNAIAERDREWARRIRGGEQDACAEVFRAYSESLYKFIYGYVRSVAIAEELVQEVFLKLWEQRVQCALQCTLRAQLYTIARGRALNHLRHERVVLTLGAAHQVEVVARGEDRSKGMDEELCDQETQLALTDAVAELPERCRATFVMYWYQQLSYAEIASVMRVSVKTVENQLAIAIKSLRRALGLHAHDG
jgi:RNA polymerase sigma-70 factor (ECF subfamily)